MNRTYRALAALAGATALTVAAVAPASGARWVHQDAVGDVESVTLTFDEENEEVTESELTPAPDNTNTDVTRMAVRHGKHRVVLTTTLRDITAASGGISYDIRTNDRSYWAEQRLGADPYSPAFELYRGNGDRVRCKGLDRRVNRTTEQAMVSIPRRCLGKPKWVRVGAGVSGFAETADTVTVWLDDSLRDGQVQDFLKLSPRVKRG